MKRPLRRVLLWLALQLLLAQQLALAHRIAHLAERMPEPSTAVATSAAEHGEGEGAAHLHSHVCTTCIAGFGLDSGATASPPRAIAVGGGAPPDCRAVSPAPTVARVLAFRSRAPPVFQD